MPLIAAPEIIEKDTLSVQIPKDLIDQLGIYAKLIKASRAHIVGEALRLTFERDRDFQAHLRNGHSSNGSAA